MTKVDWLETETGSVLYDMSDETIDFYYMAMHDNNLDLSDADRYGWLNTLFGYDIGVNAALAIINKYYLDDQDVMEIDERNEKELRDCAEELNLKLNFDYFGNNYDYMSYDYMSIPKYEERIDELRKENYTTSQLVGFIYGLYQDYLIGDATEATLYKYADPFEEWNNPSDYWWEWDSNYNPLDYSKEKEED